MKEQVQQTPRILIVDDVEANRYVLRDIILDMGYQPVLAENGAQALKIVQRVPMQLILLDIAMPEMDGYELCKILKDDSHLREIPIIFISAFDNPQDVVQGFECGGEDYITKPFIPEVIKARVGVHMKVAQTNQNLQATNRRLQASVHEQVRQMEMEKKSVLYALASVAAENSNYDEKHMERMQVNCRILSQAMQLSPQYEQIISDNFIESIEVAAPLCDLGNVAVPMDILQKNTTLSKEEYDIVKTHTTVGTKILKSLQTEGDYNDFVQMSIDVANYHHEHWDGTGYPRGLKGDEIPLSAQIVAVVSSYCALTEERVYREKFYDREGALEVMDVLAGSYFNASIYDICKKVSKQFH